MNSRRIDLALCCLDIFVIRPKISSPNNQFDSKQHRNIQQTPRQSFCRQEPNINAQSEAKNQCAAFTSWNKNRLDHCEKIIAQLNGAIQQTPRQSSVDINTKSSNNR
ncbi:unnamed protein product [Brachionus calyciflorus]|uniref:Uncharacterized protein n=1 Tax=Brachionus calyciflorus TaxID=104777 RepID=A0A813S8Y6_9BILA|nr:unnamed protein product [Brachionus calyciflorus]